MLFEQNGKYLCQSVNCQNLVENCFNIGRINTLVPRTNMLSIQPRPEQISSSYLGAESGSFSTPSYSSVTRRIVNITLESTVRTRIQPNQNNQIIDPHRKPSHKTSKPKNSLRSQSLRKCLCFYCFDCGSKNLRPSSEPATKD